MPEIKNLTDKNGNVVNPRTVGDAVDINGETLSTYIDKTNEQLSQAKQSMNNRFNQHRKFKPNFGVAPWWLTSSEETIESHIKKFKECGCEFVDIIVHTYYSEELGFHTKEQIDKMLFAYNKIIENGMSVNKIKFHENNYDLTFVENNWDLYSTFIKNEIRKWASTFSNKNIEFFTVMNEWKDMYNKEDKEAFILELLDIPKEYGFKVGLSTAYMAESIALSSNIKNKVDIFCCNIYPQVSYNMENTTYEESVNAWKYYETQAKYLKTFGKPLIISETGTQDRWESLSNPSDFNYSTSGTPANGKASEIVLYGIFNSRIQEYTDYITWWYYDSLWNDPSIKIIHDYLGLEMN